MVGTVVRVKGIKRYREPKTGRIYCYHRATGTRLQEAFGSAEFFTHLAELDAKVRDLVTKPNTLKALILDYKQSDNFRNLAPRTRSDYEKVFTFLEPLWEARLDSFTTPQLIKLRNKWRESRGRCHVNRTRIVLSVLFQYAIELGQVAANPVRETKPVRRPKDAPVVNRAWTLAERQAVLDHLPAQLRLPYAIGLCSGMREADILRLAPTAVDGGRIKIRTAKRGVWIDIPIIPELEVALHSAPGPKDGIQSIRLCLNSRGQPWTTSGFSCSFRKALKDLEHAGLVGKGLTFHGLRHTVASVLAECNDVGDEDIAAVLGQRSSRMAAHYSREADRSRRTTATMAKYKPLGNQKRRTGKNRT